MPKNEVDFLHHDEEEEDDQEMVDTNDNDEKASDDDDDDGFSLPSTMTHAKSANARKPAQHDAIDEDDEHDYIQRESYSRKRDDAAANTKEIFMKLTAQQEDRYTHFKNARFPHKAVKKAMQQVTTAPTNKPMHIVMAGITKLYIGELVEECRIVMREWGETGPIEPKHLREAYRRVQKRMKKEQCHFTKF